MVSVTYLLFTGLLQLSAMNSSYIYKWVDEKGIINYSHEEPIGIVSEKIDAHSLQPKMIGTFSSTKPKSSFDKQNTVTNKSNTLQSKEICQKATIT